MANANEIFKDRRVQIGGAVVILGGIAAAVIATMSSQNAAAPTTPAPVAAAPAAPPAPGAPAAGAPAAPPAPGAAKAQLAGAGQPRVTTNSWSDQGPASPAAPAAPGTPAAPAAGAPADASKPDPIAPGLIAAGFRSDPFVSLTKRIVDEIPAFSLIVPQRLAARPQPTPPPMPTDPNLRFGPLPQVERRVAGILFDGSVSAILETGTPGGAGTDVRVIQPGTLVPSGIPGLRDLTVASITTSEVVLRADDGRTTSVKLSNVPAAYAEAFRGAASGQGAGGAPAAGPGPGPAQGQGGPPPGFSGPGRRGGGGRRPGGFGGAVPGGA